MSKRGKIKHEVPALEDAEAAFMLLDLRSKQSPLPKTFVRHWKFPYHHPLRKKMVSVRVRFWPDGRRRVNYIIPAADPLRGGLSEQRINTNDGAKCLAKLLEIINE